ncbi:hypothetical protein GCM10009616_35890 [Microlunatus lacustris]
MLVKAGKCHQHVKHSPTYLARNSSRRERTRRTEAVQDWVAVHGWLCPGWERPAHPSQDLTAAHVVAAAHGGADGPLTVLCRSCNSRQGVAGGGE